MVITLLLEHFIAVEKTITTKKGEVIVSIIIIDITLLLVISILLKDGGRVNR